MLLQHHVVEGNGQASPMAAQHRHVFEQRKGERAHAFQQCQQEPNTAAQSYTEYKLRLKHQTLSDLQPSFASPADSLLAALSRVGFQRDDRLRGKPQFCA